MSARRTATLLLLAGAAAAGHVGYPLALHVLSRRRGDRAGGAPAASGAPASVPPLTVVIPAYREAGTIAAKLDGLRANGYPSPLELLVVAEDPDTADAAEAAGARVLRPAERLGKSQAVNVGIEAAAHEIVVLTDANNEIAQGSLEALDAHFADDRVGAVAGAKGEQGASEAVYWRFETWLKERESALFGTTIGLVGELFAVRRSAWRPIPSDIAIDDLWTALDMAERGLDVRFEPAAASIEPSAEGRTQWERRVRISAGALVVMWRKRALLDPRSSRVAWQLIGHKAWRSTAGPLAHLALLLVSLRWWRANRLAALVVATHAVGGAAALAQARGRRLPLPLRVLRQVLYLNVVALAGIVRVIRGGTATAWVKPPR